jgi:DNA-binding MurR/RpiR family transcriptional regulator
MLPVSIVMPSRSKRQRVLQDAANATRIDTAGHVDAVVGRASDLLPRLPRQQRRIAQLLVHSPAAFGFGSMRRLCAELGVDAATVVRFARALGYPGYHALQQAIRDGYLECIGLPSEVTTHDTDIGGDAHLNARLTQQKRNLDGAHQVIRHADLNAICERLVGARRVLVVAAGGAAPLGTLFVGLLRHAGLAGELVPASGAELAVALHDVEPSDVVMGISLWFVFRETLEALKLARARGATTIVIAGSARHPFAPLADELLVAPSDAGPLLCSTVAGAAILEELAARLAAIRPAHVLAHNQALWDMFMKQDLPAVLEHASGN